jgi:hypothetical protein
MLIEPEAWHWSSAAAHGGTAQPDGALDIEIWRERRNEATWREYLAARDTEQANAAIRWCTYSGRPLGTSQFVDGLEKSMNRRLAPQIGGRPKKKRIDKNQGALVFWREGRFQKNAETFRPGFSFTATARTHGA